MVRRLEMRRLEATHTPWEVTQTGGGPLTEQVRRLEVTQAATVDPKGHAGNSSL